MQEKRIDDYWNVDANRSLSDTWIGFPKFTLLKEEHSKGYTWCGRRLTRVQATTRPDNVWPEVLTKMAKPLTREESKNGQTRSQNSMMLED